MYAVNGICFNHESPRRGGTFVTRKVTRGLARICLGLENCLYLGNLDAKRDWGHAKDYVIAQWKMLQLDEPDDFVLGTGMQFSVRELVEVTLGILGIEIEWSGELADERATVVLVPDKYQDRLKVGSTIIRVDPRFFRVAEVGTLLSDPSKARDKLGWSFSFTFQDLISDMVGADLAIAKREQFLIDAGLTGEAGINGNLT